MKIPASIRADVDALMYALHAGTATAKQQHRAAHLILDAAPVMALLTEALMAAGPDDLLDMLDMGTTTRH